MNRWIWMLLFVVTVATALMVFRSKHLPRPPSDMAEEEVEVSEERERVPATPPGDAFEQVPLKEASGPLDVDPIKPLPPKQEAAKQKRSPPSEVDDFPPFAEGAEGPIPIPPPEPEFASPFPSPPSPSGMDPFSAPPMPEANLSPPSMNGFEGGGEPHPYNPDGSPYQGNYNGGYGGPENPEEIPRIDPEAPQVPPIANGFEGEGYFEGLPGQPPPPVPMSDED